MTHLEPRATVSAREQRQLEHDFTFAAMLMSVALLASVYSPTS